MLLGNLFYFNNKIHQKKIIKGISFDSRKVKKGDVFFAIEGKKTSGIKFIKEAILRGASAVVAEKKSANNNCQSEKWDGRNAYRFWWKIKRIGIYNKCYFFKQIVLF